MQSLFNVNPDPLTLDPERFKAASASYALAKVLHEETERQRIAEGGVPGGRAFAKVGLLSGPIEPLILANQKRWYDFLTDIRVVIRCADRLAAQPTQILKRVIDEIYPTNWTALLYMRAWLIEAERRPGDQKAMQSRISRLMNDINHKRHREADKRIPELWAHYKSEGLTKNASAPLIAATLKLAKTTVREKLKGL